VKADCRQYPGTGRQRGIALVTALLVVAVAVVAASAMLVTHNVAVHRSSNLRFVEQAWWYGAGVENWVGEILRKDREQGEIDYLGEDWARPVDYLPIEGGFVRGQIVDQQGCFNLNNLDGPFADAAAEQLKRLIGLLEGSDPYTAPGLVQAIQDWIDTNADARPPGGAEDGIYTGFDPPYRTANQPMQTASELLLVNGITPELYQALSPYVCALPRRNDSAINVNTASALVLASLAPGMTLKDGEALAARREQAGPYESTQDFRDEEVLAGKAVDERMISVATEYFLLTGEIRVSNGRVNLYSLILRAQDGTPHLLAHSKDIY
jgi:general secretion pathway protein K